MVVARAAVIVDEFDVGDRRFMYFIQCGIRFDEEGTGGGGQW